MDSNSNRPPLTKLCGLWENESRNGVHYFAGRIGDAKMLVFENREWKEGGREPTHLLYMQHAPRERARSQDGQQEET